MKKAKWLPLGILVAFLIYINLPEKSELKNVLYGERTSVFQSRENTTRWFFDKMGHLYPNELIPDSLLANTDAALKNYYESQPTAFNNLVRQYQLETTTFSHKNFETLQDSMIAAQLRTLHAQLDSSTEVYVLIHGFRKSLISQNSATSAFIDNLVTKEAIASKSKKRNHFIEIYWDGMYDVFEAQKRNQHRETFKIFEKEARTNAVFVGYGLRKLIPEIASSKITLISHSLGARVILSCLFNCHDDYVDETFQTRSNPSQDTIQICLIAPAIGSSPFQEYYERNSLADFKKQDNYHLHILYNEEDIVLLKKWKFLGPGPKEYGDTSLGCNYENVAIELKNTFEEKYPSSPIQVINTTIGTTHLVEHYVLSVGFNSFLNQIIE